MAGTHGKQDLGSIHLSMRSLRDRLFEEFYRSSFFKAVDLLETRAPEKARLGESLEPAREAVRFTIPPGLSFPAADIAALAAGDANKPATMAVTFLGLLGPNGVLPYWYNELALERLRDKDTALTTFLDIFHHRLLSLFSLAWKKQRFAENYRPGGRDKLSQYLLCLSGLGTPGLIERLGFAPETIAFYTGHRGRPYPTVSGIESAVAYFAGVEVTVDQFIERIVPLSDADHTRLGAANVRLGEDALCGGYVWDCATGFAVSLGPMDYQAFQQFLPRGAMLKPLFAFIRTMAGIEYEFELRIVLAHEEVPALPYRRRKPARHDDLAPETRHPPGRGSSHHHRRGGLVRIKDIPSRENWL